MFEQAKSIFQNSTRNIFTAGKKKDLTAKDVEAAREYIAAYWPKLRRFHPKDDGNVLGLPKPYLVPSHEEGREFDFNEMYYWDTYFTALGLMEDKHEELVTGMLEDLTSLFERFKIIPNASRTYLTGRSQPPFLTSFIFDVYTTYNMDEKWLKKNIELAKAEYHTVWQGTAKPNARLVYKGLSRYYDINLTQDLAEAESGWDYTPRFARRCLDYVPVCLNALLYKYETDFARAATILDNKREAAEWERAAATRKKQMDKLMWDPIRKLYYDYNYVKQKRGNVSSLAAFYPMWAGMVTEKQAKDLVKGLRRFEHKGGLATTDSVPLGQYVPGSMPRQWAYPNGWAPLHYIVIKALQRYGYHHDAHRIAMKWLRTNLDWYKRHGMFIEKFNVVSPDKPPAKGVYPTQNGFGWTNAIFERLCKEFIDQPAETPPTE